MNTQITLKEALDVWGAYKMQELYAKGGHIPIEDLYDLLLRATEIENKAELIDHLTECPICLNEAEYLHRNMEETRAWDIALPKAAGSRLKWPKTIETDGKKYLVKIRQSLTEKNSGVVTVTLAEKHPDKSMEDKTLELFDGKGRILLKGKIYGGQVSQPLDELGQIDLDHLIIKTE